MEVRLATPSFESDAEAAEQRVTLSFLADYAALQRFSRDVCALADGACDAAMLVSDVTHA